MLRGDLRHIERKLDFIMRQLNTLIRQGVIIMSREGDILAAIAEEKIAMSRSRRARHIRRRDVRIHGHPND